jgi:hypothetical protein
MNRSDSPPTRARRRSIVHREWPRAWTRGGLWLGWRAATRVEASTSTPLRGRSVAGPWQVRGRSTADPRQARGRPSAPAPSIHQCTDSSVPCGMDSWRRRCWQPSLAGLYGMCCSLLAEQSVVRRK